MQICKSYETKEGTVKFEGELEGPELDVVLQLGLYALMSRGLITTVVAQPGDEDVVH